MDRKMSTSTESLCKGFPAEFRSYFEYCRSLRFEDRPDYAYLKRLFKELFYRKGFQYDNMYDWTARRGARINISRRLRAESSRRPSLVDGVAVTVLRRATRPRRRREMTCTRLTA